MLDRIAPRYAPIDTPLGSGYMAFTPRGVVLLEVGVGKAAFMREAAKRLGVEPVRKDPPPAFRRRVRACLERGDGAVVDWSRMGGFQRKVLEATAKIPPGKVRSYAEIAQRISNPRAVRAVGTALARNPVPLLVPCHRVVRSDGTVGNYGMGTPTKRKLLRREGARIA